MRFLTSAAVGLFLQAGLLGVHAASDSKKADDPCTIHSLNSGSFYDLRSISLQPPDPEKKPSKSDKTESWHARGYDYPANFTLNICAPVLEELVDVQGISSNLWKNVSAFYKKEDKTYSIGQAAAEPIFRGRKLVLEYKNGSPCAGSMSDYEGVRRKSTTISFHCEKDTHAQAPVPAFVGTSPDECAYFFEVRTLAACAGAEPPKETIGPAGVFGIILLIAVVVYFIGGVMYQRSVTHARGWRQIPNYSLWAGIGTFIKDMLIIMTASCAHFIPRRQGYRNLNSGRGRGRNTDDENRLIDNLDEEWEE